MTHPNVILSAFKDQLQTNTKIYSLFPLGSSQIYTKYIKIPSIWVNKMPKYAIEHFKYQEMKTEKVNFQQNVFTIDALQFNHKN